MEQTQTIEIKKDLTPKLALEVVNTLNNFESSIELKYRNKKVDAKSILGLVALSIPANEKAELIVSGDDSDEAIKKFNELLGA